MSEFYEYDRALSKIIKLEEENALLKARVTELEEFSDKAAILLIEREYDKRIEELEQHIETLEKQQRWIPVHEKLPVSYRLVLSTDGTDYYLSYYYYGNWKGVRIGLEQIGEDWKPTHWTDLQQLPEVNNE